MTTASLPPLIPREVLLGNPARSSPRLSPDGKKLVYLAPHAGKMSVWAGTIGADDDRLIAHDPLRPIPWVAFRGDGQHVIYVQDRAGDENYHLFQVALSSGETRELTPGEKVRAMPLALDPRFPDQLLFTSNARDARFFDVWRMDLKTQQASLDTENPGDVIGWKNDHAFVVRAAVARSSGGSVLRVRDTAAEPWRELARFSSDDAEPRLIGFSPDGRALDVVTSASANAARLVRYDLRSASTSVLLEDATYDVADVYVDPGTHAPAAAAVLRDRLAWTALDPAFAADLAAIETGGDFAIADASADGRRLLIREQRDVAPDAYVLYDRDAGRAVPLFDSQPALKAAPLAAMQPVSFPARDGLTLHGYLTLPKGVEPRRLPTVLFVHGGPWHRDRWGFSPDVQWLANRGYAVLQINFRGSTGYGKAFRVAGDRQWAGSMRTDLLDARDWAIAEGIADPARFGIFGGSYGGYAVLTALAFTPDAFTCGIDVVGPSNLTTFLESIPPYWETMRQMLHQRIGEDAEFLRAQSPLFRAAQIRTPLLVVQGANDPRVPQRESDQMVEVLRSNGIPVTYVVFENEGHGFADPLNARRFSAVAEAFLQEHLGGRLEPAHEDEQIAPFLR
jgi:dipeptidyl aminopeptidase/acylaminoacyl peptidase